MANKRMSIAEYNRQRANKPEQPEPSAGIKKFRKNLAAERKFQSEMGQIRNTVGLQPGAGATEYKGPKRESPRERRQREMKQYSVSRTKTAPAKKATVPNTKKK